MAGKDNLRVPTSEEARAIGKKGGKKSGKVRQQRKAFKEVFSTLLSNPVKADILPEELMKLTGGKIEDYNTALAMTQLIKALNGDTQAFTVIRDTVGEKPTDKFEADIDQNITVNFKIPRPKEE